MSDTATLPASAQVRQFIQENFLYMRPDLQFTDDEPLLGRGIIDSLGVMELIGFVEEAFGIQVNDFDVTEEHFGSVAAIARYVEKSRAA
jgi:acyl carrier protein